MSATACTGCGALFEIGVAVGILCPKCHRAAQRADAERVRSVVRDALIGELDTSDIPAAWVALLRRLMAGAEFEARKRRCTGLTARWCPRCGDCACGDEGQDLDNPACPLHAPGSTHAETGGGR